MKIKVGKVYLTRDERRVHIMVKNKTHADERLCYLGEVLGYGLELYFDKDGRARLAGDSIFDLVAPDFDEEPKIERRRMIRNFCIGVVIGVLLAMGIERATAKDIAVLPNEAGGEIVFTDIPTDAKDGLVVYSRAANGKLALGRWIPMERAILVVWNDGSMSMYGYDNLQLLDSPQPEHKAFL